MRCRSQQQHVAPSSECCTQQRVLQLHPLVAAGARPPVHAAVCTGEGVRPAVSGVLLDVGAGLGAFRGSVGLQRSLRRR